MALFIDDYCPDSTYTIGRVRGNRTAMIFYFGTYVDEVAFRLRFSKYQL